MRSQTLALAYKAWLETRARFLTGAIIITVLIFWDVFRANGVIGEYEHFRGEQMQYAEYIWVSLYRGYLQAFWIFCALMLGLGGLWREQAQGTAGFTLSLPVSRRQVTYVRILVGLFEIISLGFLPALLIPLLSTLTGNHYSLSQSVSFSTLLVGGGMIFFGWGVLLSHLIQKEFTAPAVGMSAALFLYFISRLPHLSAYNIFDVMSGKHYLGHETFLIEKGMPWSGIGVSIMLTLVIIAVSLKLIRARDF